MSGLPRDPPSSDDSPVPRLALRPRDAAKALSIAERLLWAMTNQGVIPHTKLGKVTLYPVDALREFLAKRVKGAKK